MCVAGSAAAVCVGAAAADAADHADLRLQLLEPSGNAHLAKCLYGLLMLLPQSAAFNTLKRRLECVPHLSTLAFGSVRGPHHRPSQRGSSLTAMPRSAAAPSLPPNPHEPERAGSSADVGIDFAVRIGRIAGARVGGSPERPERSLV